MSPVPTVCNYNFNLHIIAIHNISFSSRSFYTSNIQQYKKCEIFRPLGERTKLTLVPKLINWRLKVSFLSLSSLLSLERPITVLCNSSIMVFFRFRLSRAEMRFCSRRSRRFLSFASSVSLGSILSSFEYGFGSVPLFMVCKVDIKSC